MEPPSVVLLGDVGTGKSTLVEKVTGIQGISSAAATSFTKASQSVLVQGDNLQIIDTPGSNAMEDKLEHNVWIAHALNYAPVALILLMVKADTRIDNTVNSVRTYAERFVDLIDLLAVCVTHMDTVDWRPSDFLPCLDDELGITSAMFVGKETIGGFIRRDIVGLLHETPQDITVTSDNFLKLFKINDSKLKIMKHVNDEVARFREINTSFHEHFSGIRSYKDKVDLVFEFQAYMTDLIIAAQKRVSEGNDFTFMGRDAGNEAGHIANLTNQLKAVLHNVRTLALGYASSHGVATLRRCPHCGLVWTKVEGCDGMTVCGNRMDTVDVRSGDFATLGTFTFQWNGKALRIMKSGTRAVASPSRGRAGAMGCGARVSWANMAPVDIPPELATATSVSTDDVDVLPEEVKPRWRTVFEESYRSKAIIQTPCSIIQTLRQGSTLLLSNGR